MTCSAWRVCWSARCAVARARWADTCAAACAAASAADSSADKLTGGVGVLVEFDFLTGHSRTPSFSSDDDRSRLCRI